MWTLWLISFSANATPSLAAMSSFSSHDECRVAIGQIYADLNADYGKKNVVIPGIFMCVAGKKP
jgi:hypothetical protein